VYSYALSVKCYVFCTTNKRQIHFYNHEPMTASAMIPTRKRISQHSYWRSVVIYSVGKFTPKNLRATRYHWHVRSFFKF